MLLLCVSDYKSMKKRIESNKQIHRKRHSCCMPRLKLLRHKRTHNYLPYKRDNRKWQKFYGSRAWHKTREAQILEHPVCERCLSKGIVKPAECVHHVTPFSEGVTDTDRWSMFLDERNLVSLCAQCHREIHNGMAANEDVEWIKHI